MTADEESKSFSENDSNEDISPASPLGQLRKTLIDDQSANPGDAPDRAKLSKTQLDDHSVEESENAVEPVSTAGKAKQPDPLIGTVLDRRFEIQEVLGAGGMSVVYKAKQLVVDRPVAIKTLHIQLQARPGAVERFRREIKSLCMLNSPNIVTVYDCIFSEDGQPFVVMDYLQGMSLEQLVRTSGPLPAERAQKIFLQISSALEHAHKNGVIHRDLKPSNVMIVNDSDEFIKVVDFGLAKLGEDNVKLTKSGEVWGSPPYMSPEQWRSEPCDARSDIYAFGALMYEALTGKDAFTADTLYQFLQKHLHETPAKFSTVNPDVSVPTKLEQVVFKALAKSPAQRYQSMSEVKEALSGSLDGDKWQAAKSHEPQRTELSGTQIAFGVMAAFLLFILFIFTNSSLVNSLGKVWTPSPVVRPAVTQSPVATVEPPSFSKPKPKTSRPDTNLTSRRVRNTNSTITARVRRKLDQPRKPTSSSKPGNRWDELRKSHTEH